LNLTAILSAAQNVIIYANGQNLSSGLGYLSVIYNFTGPGRYNISAVFSGSQNYTGNFSVFWVTADDTTDPSIDSFSAFPQFVAGAENVTFTANVLDNGNLSAVWYAVSNDSGQLASGPMALDENGLHQANYSASLTLGQYRSIAYANDTYSNVVNSSIAVFQVAQRGNFSVAAADRNGSLATIRSISVLHANSSAAKALAASSANLSNSVPAGLWDIAFSAGFNLTLRSVNLSDGFNGSVRLDENISAAGISLPANAVRFTGVVAAQADFNFSSATLQLAYDDAGFTSEGRIASFACHNWNMAARACSSAWTEMTASSVFDTSVNTAAINTTSLSGFAIAETFACGDGIQDAGETSGTCCEDAGCSSGTCDTGTHACAQPSSGGGSGGGGGGGAGSSAEIEEEVAAAVLEITSYPEQLDVSENGTAYMAVTVRNPTSANLTAVRVSVAGCDGCLISAQPEQTELAPLATIVFQLSFFNASDALLVLTAQSDQGASQPVALLAQVYCQPGKLRCSGSALETCTGGSWALNETCVEGCANNACVYKETCREGAQRCSQNRLQRCANAAWQTAEYCWLGCDGNACSTQQAFENMPSAYVLVAVTVALLFLGWGRRRKQDINNAGLN
ncbi:MAG: hypothetical protein HY519_00510, partial [Candidatus Aenigmarchaeota archaeon]|nr:hypothetical protein [Candidatus Aenigmarchaeota archaeon]